MESVDYGELMNFLDECTEKGIRVPSYMKIELSDYAQVARGYELAKECEFNHNGQRVIVTNPKSF